MDGARLSSLGLLVGAVDDKDDGAALSSTPDGAEEIEGA